MKYYVVADLSPYRPDVIDMGPFNSRFSVWWAAWKHCFWHEFAAAYIFTEPDALEFYHGILPP